MKKSTLLKAVAATTLLASAVFAPVNAGHHAPEDQVLAALSQDGRPADDLKDDVLRRPAEVLAFAGIHAGMTVLDVNSGGGYYSEILSGVVGKDGRVYAHNGPVYWEFVKKDIDKRYKDRLSNVTLIRGVSEEVEIAENSVDVILSVLAYHDYYFKHKMRTKNEDVPAILASLYKSLKPGGAFVVIDHVAPTGSGTEAGNSLHRIDPELLKAQVLAAGFKLESTSDMFVNAEDTHTKSPFDPSIRRKTDRFVFKFVK
ncbi:MAG: hypothetical protein COB37_03140 [Kordiimonadales bacterium]|nr:MAG: hypothetical protein COB37_03140 [Kordiimonadales bacterium]